MKIADIKEYELIKGCFGKDITVNGTDYEDLSKEDIIEFILDMFENDPDKDYLLQETFENLLSYLELDCVKSDSSVCEQCGDWNSYDKYVRKNEIN